VRRVIAVVALVLLALVLAQSAGADRNAFRAAVSYWAMRHTFFDVTAGRFREQEGSSAPAHAWPYSQALAATLAMTAVPKRGPLYVHDAAQRISGLGRYRRKDGSFAAAFGASGPVYYDDNEWIGLEMMRWFQLRNSGHALAGAQRIFGIVVKAWDSDATHACPGGVFWTNAPGNDDRNTVTTATGALLGLQLYAVTHDQSELAWSKRMLSWLMQCMLAPDGLLWDHLMLDGTRDESHWSYNQGTTIGANVLLYRLTGDQTALSRAETLADKSLAFFDTMPTSDEPPFFLAILFRNLLDLARVDGNPDYRAAAQSYADSVWDQVHDPKTGLFRFGGKRPVQLLEQAAMVQIYAVLATGDR
jgi:Glycosyl hydrolase family 76